MEEGERKRWVCRVHRWAGARRVSLEERVGFASLRASWEMKEAEGDRQDDEIYVGLCMGLEFRVDLEDGQDMIAKI